MPEDRGAVPHVPRKLQRLGLIWVVFEHWENNQCDLCGLGFQRSEWGTDVSVRAKQGWTLSPKDQRWVSSSAEGSMDGGLASLAFSLMLGCHPWRERKRKRRSKCWIDQKRSMSLSCMGKFSTIRSNRAPVPIEFNGSAKHGYTCANPVSWWLTVHCCT